MNLNYFIIYYNFKNKKPELIHRTWTLILHLFDSSFTCQTFSALQLQAAISMAIFSCYCCSAELNKVDVQQLFVACTIFYFFAVPGPVPSFLVCCGGSAEICNAKHAKTLSLHKYKTQVQQLQPQQQLQLHFVAWDSLLFWPGCVCPFCGASVGSSLNDVR